MLRRQVYGRGYDNLILSVHWRRESIVICTSKSKPILEPWPEANDERRRFKIVTAHPTVGPLNLILGVSGLNGPGESVADISDAFLNAGRVEKERLKLEHGSDAVGGDSFIATLAKVPKEHPGFVIASRIDKVYQRNWILCGLLVYDYVLDEPINGMVNDATHSGWRPGGNGTISRWSGRHSVGSQVQEWCQCLSFHIYILTVFQAIADSRKLEVRDELFASVRYY